LCGLQEVEVLLWTFLLQESFIVMNNLSKYVSSTFNIEIDVSDVEDDSMMNNSIDNQTNNYEDGEENIILFTEQKKSSKQFFNKILSK